MGGRLSVPKGPGGMTEISHPRTSPHARRRLPFDSRTIVAPAAAFTMACLLFVYTRVTIRAAKANAQRHRDADGGEGLSLLNESRRRHGMADKLEGSTVKGLAEGAREQLLGKKEGGKIVATEGSGRTAEEERLRAAMGKRSGSNN